jgi:hypothetical protein
MPIGDFVVTAEATGFEKLVRSGITVEAGQTQRVDMVLRVGQVTEKVEVVGNVAKVETEGAALSDVVTSKQIDNLALNGENVFGLEFLVPGAAIADSQGSAMELGHAGGEVSVSFNGNRNEYSQIEYDGGNNAQESSQASGGAVTPGVETIAEFRILTNNADAEYGNFDVILQMNNDFGPDSDLDVLVEFAPDHVPGLAFFAMEQELSELLGRPVPLVSHWLDGEAAGFEQV